MSQQELPGFNQKPEIRNQEPVECLGMTFENDEKRREYFLEKLREKLMDPEFRKIEGFPIGEDEDILALSDPPYYTACPNPWIADFIKEWKKMKPQINTNEHKSENNNSCEFVSISGSDSYSREPFAADVSEGKNDPIYNAHSYHTKVPHKAIMRYILHYTEPGDIVFDGFCGTGMTGVAAQMCGNRTVVESLGYKVKPDGAILRQDTDDNGKSAWTAFSKLGARRAVLNDLSPAATFIAYNYNTPVDVAAFEQEAERILKEVEEECGWMYETRNSDGRIGKINYTVWSDVFICPECAGEVIFWEAAVDKEAGKVRDTFPCPHCRAELTKRKMERAWITIFDSVLKKTIKQAKQVPVLINYTLSGARGRFEKKPDEADLALIEKIENSEVPFWFPAVRMMEGKETRRNDPIGITHVHHFYTKRNLWVISSIWKSFNHLQQGRLALTSILIKTASKLHNIGLKNGKINLAGALPNALYIPASIAERNIFTLIKGKIEDFSRADIGTQHPNLIENSSLTSSQVKNLATSIDYIFIDPPFGSNLNYSELNFLWEAWLGVITENTSEAIENPAQQKGLNEYKELMTAAFRNLYCLLKPGRWMTVEFSNTSSSVWNSIQAALSDAGFVVANVAALNKGQGTFMSQTTTTAVKQDLVISAYKPNGGFEERFQKEAQTEEGVWDFVRTHLKYLPVTKKQGSDLVPVPERDPRILFDQMVAFFVRKGYPVPISSQEFQIGLAQRFIERDGMFFLSAQAAEYDRKKMLGGGEQIQLSLFVSDEASAIAWLRNLIRQKPQTFQDINPLFMKEIGGWQKHEKALELSELLEQNFLRYDGTGEVPSQIHSYLSSNFKELRNLEKDDPALKAKAKNRWYVPDPNKAGDLEKLRERALIREFEEYRESKQKRLKVFRLEAVRAGFRKAWQERDYATIITVARKIPDKILQEDPKLLMWYDQAVTRSGEE